MIDRLLNIGIVCPYGWDAPGGVQAHIADLRSYLVKQGHQVSVLAPTADEESLPDWVVSAGKPLSIPYFVAFSAPNRCPLRRKML